MKQRTKKFALLFISASASLFAVEIFLQIIEKPTAKPDDEFTMFYTTDPVLGWRGLANANGYFTMPESHFFVTNNALGYRDRERAIFTGSVAVYGDSFVWGYGVNQDERLTDIAEHALAKPVLNRGITGYAPDQAWLLYQTDETVKSAQIVVCFLNDTDLRDMADRWAHGHPRPYIHLQDNRLSIIQPANLLEAQAQTPSLTWMDKTWHAAQTLILTKRMASVIGRNTWFQKHIFEGVYKRHRKIRNLADTVPTLVAIFKAWQSDCVSTGARFIVVAFPLLDETKGTAQFRCWNEIESQCRSAGIDLFDWRSSFVARQYFPRDGHWNSEGHHHAAMLLTNLITEQTR
ncbi:MAG: SGNH/GDSL hydrolase family protein [Lentisphaerae bacterium]|nr:SGNH/GDSL hydrolase family protein [Lentisphaerota bacterium]